MVVRPRRQVLALIRNKSDGEAVGVLVVEGFRGEVGGEARDLAGRDATTRAAELQSFVEWAGTRRPEKCIAWRCSFVLLMLVPSACTNLSAVRDFAKTSSAVSANEPVISGWPHVYDTAKMMAASPQVSKVAPDIESRLKSEAKAANADISLALEAGKTLSLYMNVLDALADNSLPDVSEQATSISSSLDTLGVVNDNTKSATGALLKVIGISMNAWREQAIGALIKKSNGDVQTISAFLAATANAVEKADKLAMRVSDQYWEATGALSKDPGVQALLLRAERQDDQIYALRLAQAEAARVAFNKIAAAHAVLAKNADSLSGDEVRNALSNDVPVLISALQIFQRNQIAR